jgi:rhodanese-related sulfurtransferase
MFNKYLKFLIPMLMLQNFISCSQITYSQVDYNFFLNFESNKILIDVRSDEEISIKSVDDFIQIDFYKDDFYENLLNLDKEENIFLICRSGRRSGLAAQFLAENGYSKIYNIKGGINSIND